MVVGSEASAASSGKALVYWDGKRLIRKKRGRFLRSMLVESKQNWPIVKAKGIIRVTDPSFWMSGGKWHIAREGEKATGTIKSMNGGYPQIEVIENDAVGWK